MDLLYIITTILFIVNILFASVLIFLERKDAGTTWAWLLILFFIPFIGFVIYLFLGQNLTRQRLFQCEGVKKIGIEKLIRQQLNQIGKQKFDINETVEDYRDLIYLHLKNNDAVLTLGNEIELFTDGRKKFNQLLIDIMVAKEYIHIQYYIFRKDSLGQEIINALVKKAEEGVEVRLLYDDLGSRQLGRKDLKRLVDAGGEIGVFFPSKFALINLRLNYRNHRKLVNIDGQIGYVGGFNVGEEYVGLSEKFGYWRDTHIRISGKAVDAIQTRFILDWNQAMKRRPIVYDEKYFPAKEESNGEAPVQIVSSGPDSEWEQVKNGYIKMIMSAKESVFIQTPYFVPDQSLLDALRIAALSGKDVRVMIPKMPDHPFIYWATYFYVGELLKTGAKVYIYQKGFMHAKTIVIDRKICSIGTANIDIRSFKLNFEVNAFIYHPSTSENLAYSFEEDMTNSIQLTPELYGERSRLIRIKESISRLLSPIL